MVVMVGTTVTIMAVIPDQDERTINPAKRKEEEEMKKERIHYIFLFIGFVLVLSSCHPRHVSDIRPNMTKEEVISLWGTTDLITYSTANGKNLETWEYHFASSNSICWITFVQDRVTNTRCQQRPRYYYSYPYGYYPYPYGYYYPYYYRYGPYWR